MTNALKVQKLAITAFITVVMAFLFLNLFTVQAHAAGLLDETIDTAHEFSRYPIDNYQLDFMWILRGIGCRGTGWMVSAKRRSMQFTCLQTSCGR